MRKLVGMVVVMMGFIGLTGCGPIETDIQGYCYELMECGYGFFPSYEECVDEIRWEFRTYRSCSDKIEEYYACVMDWKCYEQSYSSLSYMCGGELDDLNWCIDRDDVYDYEGDEEEDEYDLADLIFDILDVLLE